MISAKFVPLKYFTLSSQLRRLTSFSVGCSGRRILSPGQIAVMRKWSIDLFKSMHGAAYIILFNVKIVKITVLGLSFNSLTILVFFSLLLLKFFSHIISYHIISYHIISYHIISTFIPISLNFKKTNVRENTT